MPNGTHWFDRGRRKLAGINERRARSIGSRLFLSISALVALGAGVPHTGGLGWPGRVAASQTTHVIAADSTRNAAPAQTIRRTFWSEALGREMPVTVFLPPGYNEASVARYPVLYMLHGLGGDSGQWAQDGLLASAATGMASHEIAPFLIVLPDGERGYWMDHAADGPRFGTYISRDLVTMVDHDYRTLAVRESRAVGGMSMGGHGALQLALNHPEIFSVVGAHSVALRRKDQAFAFFGDDRYFAANDPVSLIQSRPDAARRLEISIDIGASDQWAEAATAFHHRLEAAGIAHAWTLQPGAHDDAYWSAHAADYLRYYSDALTAHAGAPGV